MSASPQISDAPPKRRIAVFLDGTWNTVVDNTNVWRLKALCADRSTDGAQQIAYYDSGVTGFLGGTFGKGLSGNIIRAYDWLVDQFNPGDELFIFGFSRGAYTARSLAGFIAKCGMLKPGSPLGVGQLFERYRRPDDRTLWRLIDLRDCNTLSDCTLEEKWMLNHSQPVPIKMVAVWDTVGTLGLPAFKIPGISRSTLGFLHTGLRTPVEHGFHALAIDERRKSFSPTLWTVRKPKDTEATIAPPRPFESVEQRWFTGAHANVGGGCRSDLLAQIPLRWIMKKASICGLSFRADVDIDKEVYAAPISDSYREFMRGLYSKFSWPFTRQIAAPTYEDEDSTHSTVNESIDASVFERCRFDAEYRPQSLVAWADRFGVELKSLRSSVLANSPNTAAPD